jgi:glycosyltransferase involved in cell wall biosynthesis
MRVSVIIPTYRGGQKLLDCIESVLEQTRLPDELIVVDSSDDDTPNMVKQRFPTVRLFHFPERVLYGDARNIGAEKARGEILVFTDDDCLVDRRWLQELERPFEDPQVHWACGAVWPADNVNEVAAADFWVAFSNLAMRVGGRSVLTHAAYNIAYRRETFWKMGGFPAGIMLSDRLFFERLKREYSEPVVVPSAIVLHRNPTDLATVKVRHRRIGHMFVHGRQYEPSLPGARLLTVRGARWLLPWVRHLLFWWRLSRFFPRQAIYFLRRFWLVHSLFREWYAGVHEALEQGENFDWRTHAWGTHDGGRKA